MASNLTCHLQRPSILVTDLQVDRERPCRVDQIPASGIPAAERQRLRLQTAVKHQGSNQTGEKLLLGVDDAVADGAKNRPDAKFGAEESKITFPKSPSGAPQRGYRWPES